MSGGRSTSGEPLSDRELTIFRGVSGANNGAAGAGRPDLSGAASLLPGQFNERDARVLTELNAAVRLAKSQHATVTAHPIPPHQWRVFCFVDSSCDTSGNQRNQNGSAIGVSTPELYQGCETRASVSLWRSQRQRRKVRSPQLCETYAASAAVRELAWV